MSDLTPPRQTDRPDITLVSLLAVVIGLVVVVAGKLLAASFGLAYSEVDTVVEDPDMMAKVVLYEMAEADLVERDLVEYYKTPADQRQPSADMTRRLMKVEVDITSRIENMSQAEREAAVTLYADEAIGEVPVTERMGFSGWDLIWFGLAFYVVFRMLAAGRREKLA